jgi:hypothetical protein
MSQPSAARIPRPIVTVHGEDVNVEIPRLLTVRAAFLSEGLFDETSGGDPEEEDLYDIEVTDLTDELLEPIGFARLFPSSSSQSWLDEEEEEEAPSGSLPAEKYALALAWSLANAHPSNWSDVCEAARGWDSWMIEDVFERLPPEWTPEVLLPEED